MINFILQFLFILSIVYLVKYILEFIFKLISTEAEPIRISKLEGVFYYLAVSYIITYILN